MSWVWSNKFTWVDTGLGPTGVKWNVKKAGCCACSNTHAHARQGPL